MDHRGITQNCTSCHQKDLPLGPVPALAGPGITPFDHAKIGTTDCASCHLAMPQNLGVTWAGGHYPHPASLTSCTSCHSSAQWPTRTGPFVDANGSTLTSFNHAVMATGDCFSCHQKALAGMNATPPTMSWSGTGSTYPASLAAITDPDPGSTDYSISASAAQWGGSLGTTIVSVSTSTLALHQTMNHTSIEVTGSTLQNCAACHSGAASGIYRPGLYHASLGVNQPKTCSDCHGPGTLSSTGAPTSGIPSGLVGTTGAARNPASPEMDHGAMTWALVAGKWTHTSTSAFTQDCALCHTQPGGSWSGANFHTTLAAAGKSQPSSCLDCHANNRPSGLVPVSVPSSTPTQFDHANAQGDCVACHVPPTNTSASVPAPVSLWANGKFHAGSGVQASCATCHEPQRPTGNSGWVGANSNAPFVYTQHFSGMDCAQCHQATATFTSMGAWSGGLFAHKAGMNTCLPCHTIPDSSWYPTVTVSHTAGSDCVGCHTAALTNVIQQGLSPANSAWVGTGSGNGTTPPAGVAGNQVIANVSALTLNASASPPTTISQVSSSSTSAVSLPLGILHSSSQIPSPLKVNGSLDCAKCHTGPALPSGINQGYFHSSITAAGAAQPATCAECHSNTLNGVSAGVLVGQNLRFLDHGAMLSNGKTVLGNSDCASCHSSPGVSGAWLSTGRFHANLGGTSPQNCTLCHYPEVQSIVSTVKNHMNHSSKYVTQDCVSCHAMPTSTQTAQSGYPTVALWSGGKFHSKLSTQPATCTECHSGERPAATTQSLVDSTSPTLQYMNHASQWATSDCATCHMTEVGSLAPGASPTSWSKTASFHSGITSGVNSCKECHGTTNGLATNTIPASLTTNDHVSALGNAGSIISPYFNPPANGSPIYDFVNHADLEVTSRDCKSCHAVPAAGAGSDYALWAKGAFHANVATVSAGQCLNCHANIMPDDSFAAFKHVATLVTTSSAGTIPVPNNPGTYLKQDCGACHGANVGVNWTGASAASPHTASFLQTASCVSCHASGGASTYSSGVPVGMPTGPVTITVMSSGNPVSMSFYHVTPSSITRKGGSGTVTLKGTFDFSQTACVYCHGKTAAKIEVASGSSSIINGTPTGTGWSGGIMNVPNPSGYHMINPSGYTYTSGTGITSSTGGSLIRTCAACHENERPSTTHYAGQDCAGCHGSGTGIVGRNWN